MVSGSLQPQVRPPFDDRVRARARCTIGTNRLCRGFSAMHMKIGQSQFTIDGDRLIHQPTGAVFQMGEKAVVNCEWGETKLASGYDYDRTELREAAREILLARRVFCLKGEHHAAG